MIKCPHCDLTSTKINAFLTKHWKKHCTDSYTKADYKRDLLTVNGRPPKICPYCDEETVIPKGDSKYPKYHKQCYLKNIKGKANPNYRGGKHKAVCRNCQEDMSRYSSQILVKEPFCSTTCSMNFYAEPENRTAAQLKR